MNNSKYKIGDLVTCNSEILEVLRVFEKDGSHEYELTLRAFTREPEPSEWHNQIIPNKSIKKENELNEFKYSKPKFNFGDRVVLGGNDCVIRFIQFEKYIYQCLAMSIDPHYGPTGLGWKKEESYFSRK